MCFRKFVLFFSWFLFKDKEKNEVYIEFRPEEKYQFPNKNLNLGYSMERLEQKKAKEKITEVCYLEAWVVCCWDFFRIKFFLNMTFFFSHQNSLFKFYFILQLENKFFSSLKLTHISDRDQTRIFQIFKFLKF